MIIEGSKIQCLLAWGNKRQLTDSDIVSPSAAILILSSPNLYLVVAVACEEKPTVSYCLHTLV